MGAVRRVNRTRLALLVRHDCLTDSSFQSIRDVRQRSLPLASNPRRPLSSQLSDLIDQNVRAVNEQAYRSETFPPMLDPIEADILHFVLEAFTIHNLSHPQNPLNLAHPQQDTKKPSRATLHSIIRPSRSPEDGTTSADAASKPLPPPAVRLVEQPLARLAAYLTRQHRLGCRRGSLLERFRDS